MTKDGSQISVEFTIVLLHDPSQRLIGMAAILRDVTARFEEPAACDGNWRNSTDPSLRRSRYNS